VEGPSPEAGALSAMGPGPKNQPNSATKINFPLRRRKAVEVDVGQEVICVNHPSWQLTANSICKFSSHCCSLPAKKKKKSAMVCWPKWLQLLATSQHQRQSTIEDIACKVPEPGQQLGFN